MASLKCPMCREQASPLPPLILHTDLDCPVCFLPECVKNCILFSCGHWLCKSCFNDMVVKSPPLGPPPWIQSPTTQYPPLIPPPWFQPPSQSSLLVSPPTEQTPQQIPPQTLQQTPPYMCSYRNLHPGYAHVQASAKVKTRARWRLVCTDCRRWFEQNGHTQYEHVS